MSVVPGEVDTARQPPMTVPLRHFVVGTGFLLAGVVAGAVAAVGGTSGLGTLAHVHLLLAGWVCLTIMGAMTQFVPVWSGAALHSERLATAQLWLVSGGLAGFATSLFTATLASAPVFAAAMLVGFWTFVYNVGRTLLPQAPYDVTERHFGVALGFFLLVTLLGFLLAVDFVRPAFAGLPVTRADVVSAHVTLAVFGAVTTTVLGALYQLATMFTQTSLHGVDVPLRRVEEAGYPAGVALLAVGRLVDSVLLARVGAVLLVAALAAFTVILARRLLETQVDWTPMLSRYAVATAGFAAWAALALPAWVADPLAPAALFGAPGTVHLFVVGAVGFVVLGTLYHVVPFIVWVHRYSDLLGYEAVPMIDDLYSDRVAAADLGCFVAGTALLVAADLLGLPAAVAAAGGVLVLAGSALFVANLLSVIRTHSPASVAGILLGRSVDSSETRPDESAEPSD
ncbi:hypothetical protein [Halobaculum sp. D14]|uniref:hypothetical protein n=1 Tax=Halobaculum sp. D14 TaxID=3421642 RepID=UPI003EBAA72E